MRSRTLPGVALLARVEGMAEWTSGYAEAVARIWTHGCPEPGLYSDCIVVVCSSTVDQFMQVAVCCRIMQEAVQLLESAAARP